MDHKPTKQSRRLKKMTRTTSPLTQRAARAAFQTDRKTSFLMVLKLHLEQLAAPVSTWVLIILMTMTPNKTKIREFNTKTMKSTGTIIKNN